MPPRFNDGLHLIDGIEGVDMATALHPQTILATHYAGAPIGRAV